MPTTPTLSELEARYAEAKKATDTVVRGREAYIGNVTAWELICAERLAAAAVIEEEERMCIDMMKRSALLRIDIKTALGLEQENMADSYLLERIRAVIAALSCKKCGGTGTTIIAPPHEKWYEKISCPACGPIRESIRREPHA